MSSSNFFVPQPDNGQYPPSNYFGNDDDYDNIDCELLLEFFGNESTGPSRLSYDINSCGRQNSVFPLNSNDNPLAPGLSEQYKHMYDREGESTSRQFDLIDVRKEKLSAATSKIKKQKYSMEEARSKGQYYDAAPTQINHEHSRALTNDSTTHSVPMISKNSTSKIIQLEASKDRRRERNKVLARKTRCKKKAEFETLRKQLLKLRTENDRLKELVKGTLPSPVTAEILLGYDVQLPGDVAKVVQAMINTIEAADPSLLTLVSPSQRSFCVSNAIANDNPIVYASPGFMELTGYDMHGILGHNCRILQGKETDRNEVRKLRLAIEEGREELVVVKNYRRDGSSYWSRVQIAPIRDSNDRVTLIVSVQYEVPGPMVGMFLTAISDDLSGSHLSNGDETSNDGNSSGSGTSPSPSSSSSDSSSLSCSSSSPNRSCASFADDRSGSCNGSTSGGGNSSSGYSSNDNRSTDGVSDQGDTN